MGKFYEPDEECVGEMCDVETGQWTTREAYEQLEKERDQWKRDAVEMAKQARRYIKKFLQTVLTQRMLSGYEIKDAIKHDPDWVQAQAIIDRYEKEV